MEDLKREDPLKRNVEKRNIDEARRPEDLNQSKVKIKIEEIK